MDQHLSRNSLSETQNNVAAYTIEPENNNLEGVNDEYWRYIPLLKAALIRGDWDMASRFFDQDPRAIKAPITDFSETVLHIAVGTGESAIHFVEKLVERMPVEALKQLDSIGNTALHAAANVGNTRASIMLVRKNPELLYIRGQHNLLPIHCAALYACKDTLLFLLKVPKDDHVSTPFSDKDVVQLVNYAISSGFYGKSIAQDVALELVQRYPQAAKSKDDDNMCALGEIARKASAFPSGSRLKFWERVIYCCVPVKLQTVIPIKDPMSRARGDPENPAAANRRSQGIAHKYIWSICAELILKGFSISALECTGCQKLQTMLWKVFEFLGNEQEIRSLHDSNVFKSYAKDALIIAARLGIHEVIEEIVDSYPKLIWTRDDNDDRTIFQRAVIERHENVFNLLYQMGDYKRYLMLVQDNHLMLVRDTHEDTMLHLAGRLAPRIKLDLVPGAALQMQRELQWFKEVEKQIPPMYKESQNKSGETPAMVFTREHEKLVEEGQKWMKDTANSCTIVAALIVTVVFAAAITVPGGSDNTGLPIFSKKTAFIAFAVSDAISLFTSTTSLLMFLSILTSRYAESDFLYVLPKRLIIGLSTLFLSITTMMVAFSATLYLLFGHDKLWILIPVAVLASLPVTSFVSLQFPLLVDLISTTYGPGIFGKQSDRPFY
ncbi:hypothetical protein RHSIM_Rhsim05G0147100 [Rhododendron simsii]|uniref:PGG domain-containing protein n=1 Tax=Rhododendron simsii TaxID=118357 RepID=A0A834GXX2_RHOSS|nr:hypothetical protein RHSIM_Rhsim05G0147100 [Rhododendron simsii]